MRSVLERTQPTADPVLSDRGGSMFVNGVFPKRRALVIGLAALFGFALTVVWSYEFVDQTIGANVAGTLLGHDAATASLAGSFLGVAFALATGVGGTFTACNVAVFSAMAPLAGRIDSRRTRLRRLVKPLGLLAAGSVAVSAAYGVVVALVGTSMPQFQLGSSRGHGGFSPSIVQAMITFGVIGAVMVYLGLASLGLVRDPLARLAARFPNAPLVVMGVLLGGFLVGRPYPLFRRLFHDAAESGNVLYGASAFALQAVGNLVIMSVLFVLLTLLAGRRLGAWLTARPSRASAAVAAAFIGAGVFMVLYWDVRMLATRDLIWYPLAPWA
ncbi:hypothetical protein [Streptomyces sp. PTD5-9]|uniref:hypothetical protein n=1 Tax=Streptomyces sp. PTD5-9 TaxID=3120150 RepID=UPI00300AF520